MYLSLPCLWREILVFSSTKIGGSQTFPLLTPRYLLGGGATVENETNAHFSLSHGLGFLSLSLFPPAGIRLKSLLRVSRDLRCNEVSLLRRSVHFSTCFFPNKPCFTLLKYSKPISAMSQDTFSRLDSSKNHGWSGADKGMEKWKDGPLE